MTTADKQHPAESAYPWRTAPALVPGSPSRSSVHGDRAGLVTRSLANVVDLGIVVLAVAGGYVAVAATRFLLHPAGFTFPETSVSTLLLAGLCVEAVYFAVTWAVVGGTYGDRLLELRVTDDRRARLGWKRCTVRSLLCTVFPIGLLWVLVSRENRSVQDVLLRTSVVYD